MLGAIYTSLSGLTAYSKGLEVISNNVANLNTPGFKVSDPLFREIVYRHLQSPGSRGGGQHPAGAGVELNAASISFRQGDLRDTGNALDVAIDGSGFFVLSRDGQQLYTRAGQFEFDKDGILVERDSGARVLVSTEGSSQGFFDLNSARVNPPRATTEVSLGGTLARAASATTHELPNVTVFDANGGSTVLKARFTHDAANPLRWVVEILRSSNNAVLGQGEVVFAENGTPLEGSSSFTVTIDPDNADPFDVTFDAGDVGSFAGVTSPASSTTSQVQMLRQDGLALGSLTKTEFDDKGQLQLTYSNGETTTGATLVLAQFLAPEQLQTLGRSLYVASESNQPILGAGLSNGFGRVMGGRVELSNVELTEQFTDLIIVQRGYQASSQISSVANEMIQQLLAMESGR